MSTEKLGIRLIFDHAPNGQDPKCVAKILRKLATELGKGDRIPDVAEFSIEPKCRAQILRIQPKPPG